MKSILSSAVKHRAWAWRSGIIAVLALAGLALPGCHGEKKSAPSVTEPPLVTLKTADFKPITRTVGQPSFVEAYERTSIFPKMTGYIKPWTDRMIDIGDKVKKGQILAKIDVPELEEEWETKKNNVELDEKRIELADQVVEVSKADILAAKAKLDETKAILGQFDASVKRWEIQVSRLRREVARGVVDEQVLLETERELESKVAEREAAKANILKADADLLSKSAKKVQDEFAVKVARANLKVSISEAKRLGKLVDYLVLPSPFDGIIHVRNANTGDFVLPATGDPTAMQRSPFVSSTGAAPIYVVDRTDIVRIFVDVPESDANYVKGDIENGKMGSGTPATVYIKAYKDELIPATVTRTAWALNVKSRTLRAEIDLPNTDAKILPGMYAYVKLNIEVPKVRSLPTNAIITVAEKSYVWIYDNGKARRLEVQTGISDGDVTEVTNKYVPGHAKGQHSWKPFDGTEKVILCDDMALLTEGEMVRLAGDAKAEAKPPTHAHH